MRPSSSPTQSKINGCTYIMVWLALMIGALVFSTKQNGRSGRYPLGAMGMIVYPLLHHCSFTKGLVKVNGLYN